MRNIALLVLAAIVELTFVPGCASNGYSSYGSTGSNQDWHSDPITLNDDPEITWNLTQFSWSSSYDAFIKNESVTPVTFDYIWDDKPIYELPQNASDTVRSGTLTLKGGEERSIGSVGQSGDGRSIYVRIWNVRTGFLPE